MPKKSKNDPDDKSEKNGIKTIPHAELFNGMQSSVDVFFASNRDVPGFIKTGFKSLDAALGGGLAKGLTILGAKPGSGKTSLVHQIAESISSRRIPVLYFSLEMSREQISAKSLNRSLWLELAKPENQKESKNYNSITSRDFIFNNIPKEANKELLEPVKKAANEKLKYFYVVEPGEVGDGSVFDGTIAKIRTIIEKFIEFCGRKQPVVIIDYLQIVSAEKEYATERQNVDAVIKELFPIKTKIPIILISSLNRGSYTNEKDIKSGSTVNMVNMGSFKESGNIEFSAEVLIGMQDITGDENTEPRKVSLKLLKHRYGRPGSEVVLYYERKHDLFTEMPNRFDGAMGVPDSEIEKDELFNKYITAVDKMKKKVWVPN